MAVQTLAQIEELSINDDIKEQLTKKVLETIGIEQQKVKKFTRGSQQKIIEALRELGGQAVRSQIVEATGLDPNAVSSLLNKLVKLNKVQKIAIQKFEDDSNKTGRGLDPDYIYFLFQKNDD
ncbi:hypothetical protein [Fischerella sp. PCC 9605]|uniref:hypothetical protein n=1 Tax=Fischerella sp. PCC 9605 TaxID=1173024 RepID=UPI001E5D9286|nr:hypothetical protein [Fischerella sp. PCC 9605]